MEQKKELYRSPEVVLIEVRQEGDVCDVITVSWRPMQTQSQSMEDDTIPF